MQRSATRLTVLALLAISAISRDAWAEAESKPAKRPEAVAGQRIAAAYPEAIEKIDGNWLVWRDGTRMPLDDGVGAKSFTAWLDNPDIEDMLRLPYVAGAGPAEPAPDDDPGRARNAAFFDKMYGDCRKGEVKGKLTTITWLPSTAGQRLEVTTVNGVAQRLEAISKELDSLPPSFRKFLAPAGGTYNCRSIAGTPRTSAHGYGIAIDIAVGQSDYWRWAGGASGKIAYRNRIPLEIVHIFERHGFIWGGRWYHYDTMHFEYRPELLPLLEPGAGPEPPPAPAEK
ncbi:M15 family metallopeptidase [uncultured Hyphomicrobium sp.]|uniref:M15 family metallopeptidase n=1 Tax=uncultured Hyphomicrobium sp. TaxID=194373 RepID=UPI0025FF293F|nr:M15 family metallopeptidase [uncultured Hyphomicrobium sp.]